MAGSIACVCMCVCARARACRRVFFGGGGSKQAVALYKRSYGLVWGAAASTVTQPISGILTGCTGPCPGPAAWDAAASAVTRRSLGRSPSGMTSAPVGTHTHRYIYRSPSGMTSMYTLGVGLPELPCCPGAGARPPPEVSPGAWSP